MSLTTREPKLLQIVAHHIKFTNILSAPTRSLSLHVTVAADLIFIWDTRYSSYISLVWSYPTMVMMHNSFESALAWSFDLFHCFRTLDFSLLFHTLLTISCSYQTSSLLLISPCLLSLQPLSLKMTTFVPQWPSPRSLRGRLLSRIPFNFPSFQRN